MKKTTILLLALLAAASPAFSGTGEVKGWLRRGTKPDLYDMGVTDSAAYQNKKAAFIRSKAAVPDGFGTLMQEIDAAAYLGKRVRLTGYIRSNDLKRWAGLWMRVDGLYAKVLSFDNMEGRPIKGTTPWTHYAVVLDVPKNAQLIAFGILLDGEGGVQISQIRISAVGADIPTTSAPSPSLALPKPANLDFEE